jgi:hypothetical protein
MASNALFNLFFTMDNQQVWYGRLITGVWLAQPILLGTWAAIGPPPAIKRLPLTMVALFFLAIITSIHFYTGSFHSRLSEAMFIMAGLFLGSAILVWVVGRRVNWQIESHAATSEVATNQFSLRFLIGLMTIIGITLALARLLGASNSTNAALGANLIRLTRAIGVILLATLPFIAVPVLMLSRQPTVRIICLLIIAWLIATLSAGQIIATFDRVQFRDVTLDLFGFQLGGAVAGAITAMALRKGGYRVVMRRPATIVT